MADAPTLHGDRVRLRELLVNLFENAIRHAGPAVSVRVGALGTDEQGFYVEDDGPGIPAGDRETVFERGYSTAEGGTGFGLAIVAEIAEAHGWTISITDAEGGGARFRIARE